MNEDWRYNDERMELRQEVYNILLNRFGGLLNENGEPAHSTQSLYECAHDWVSQGNPRPDGILQHYENYYRVKLS